MASPNAHEASRSAELPGDSIISDESISLPEVGTDVESQTQFIKDERQKLKMLIVQCKKGKGLAHPTPAQTEQLERLASLIKWLDLVINITPDFRQATQIDTFLKAVSEPHNYFPQRYQEAASAVYNKWEEANWGAPTAPVVEPSSEDPAPRKKAASSGGSVLDKSLWVPARDDPLWGIDGVMHGIALNVSGGRSNRIEDPRYRAEKRDFRAFGDNGLTSGDWFPFRIVALFHGAHGASMAGISGDAQTGAYSIVVSGGYDDFDKDEGDRLWYCGPGSNDNTDPKLPAQSSGTRALYASLESGGDVRVLRSSNGKSAWAPNVGIRYDGLYRVVKAGTTTNNVGGRVERFRLQRKEDQPAIDQSRPTREERRQYDLIQQTSPRGGWRRYE